MHRSIVRRTKVAIHRRAKIGAIVFVILFAWFAGATDRVESNLLALSLLHNRYRGALPVQLDVESLAISVLESSRENTGRRLAAMWLCEYSEAEVCESAFREILRVFPDDPLSQLHLGTVLMEKGREDEAMILWRQAGAARYWAFRGAEEGLCSGKENGLVLLKRAVTVSSDDELVQYLLGRKSLQCQKWPEAVSAFSAALSTEKLSQTDQHSALLGRALAAYECGTDFEEIVADVNEAIRLQPDNPWSRIRLCALYRQEMRHDEAITACNEAVRLGPNMAAPFYYRGRVWQDMGFLDRAKSDYEQALQLDPELAAAKDWLEKLGKQ